MPDFSSTVDHSNSKFPPIVELFQAMPLMDKVASLCLTMFAVTLILGVLAGSGFMLFQAGITSSTIVALLAANGGSLFISGMIMFFVIGMFSYQISKISQPTHPQALKQSMLVLTNVSVQGVQIAGASVPGCNVER